MYYQTYYQPTISEQMQASLAVYQQKQIISTNAKISEEAARASIKEDVEQANINLSNAYGMEKKQEWQLSIYTGGSIAMGRYCEKNEISWNSLLIYGSSFLRVLLKDFGYAMDEGLVLVADNELQGRQFVSGYCKGVKEGSCKMLRWSSRSKVCNNYCAVFMPIKETTKEEAVEDFLVQEHFLPVVVAGGLVPEYLCVDRLILRLTKEDVENVRKREFIQEITR